MQLNYQDRNLHFLKEKINEIKIALFKTDPGSDLQLPNNVIQTFSVDNDGTVWFFTAFNGNFLPDMERPFYAHLSYIKKGVGHLQLSGKASITGNEDKGIFSMSNYAKGTYGRLVLVKMKIMQAEFSENKVFKNNSWTEKLKYRFSHLFLQPIHRTYDFSD